MGFRVSLNIIKHVVTAWKGMYNISYVYVNMIYYTYINQGFTLL